MKRTLYFWGVILTALVAVSCAKETLPVQQQTEEQTTGKVFGETVFTLSAVMDNSDESKVSLDGIHMSWTEGDKIVVNGVTSLPLKETKIKENGGAEFEFDKVLNPPFYAVYPASAYVEGSYTPVEGETPATNIKFPAKHTYHARSIDPATAIMVGTASEGGNIRFSHAVTCLKLTFDKDVKSVRVMANNGMRVAGYLKIDYANKGTSNYYDTSNYNTVTMTGDISAGSPVVIAIPAKNYTSGLNIFVVTSDNQYQVLKTSAFDATSKKGTLLVKSATLSSPKQYYGPGIYNEEDWKSFVFADESKYSTDLTQKGDASDWLGEDGEYNLYEDFTVKGNLKRHGENAARFTTTDNIYFTGVLDGNGHTITQTASTVPMFSYLGAADEEGTVKNLTLAGDCTSIAESGWGNASFAIRVLKKGTISGCTNAVNTVITEDKASKDNILLAGFAASNQGTITNCVNNGNMEYKAYYSDPRKCYVGGICSQNWNSTFTDQGYGDFLKCTNNGKLKVTKESDKDKQVSAQYTVIGGICAGVMGGVPGTAYTRAYSSFDTCSNTGEIVFWEDDNGDKYSVICGGIIGASTPYNSNCPYVSGTSGYYFIVRGGKNTGNFDVSSSGTSATTAAISGARQVYIGGLVGFALGSPALNGTAAANTNYAIIRGGSNCTMKLGSVKGNECAGGIVGGGGFLSLEYITDSFLRIEKTGNTMFTPTKIGAVGALIGLNVKRTLVTGNNNSPLLKIDASNAGLPVSFEGLSGNTGATSAAANGKPESTKAVPYLIYEKSSSSSVQHIIKFSGKKSDGSTYTAGALAAGTTTSGVECFYGSGNTLVRDAGRVTVVDYTE